MSQWEFDSLYMLGSHAELVYDGLYKTHNIQLENPNMPYAMLANQCPISIQCSHII